MTAYLPLSVIGVVIAFVIGMLGAFPMREAITGPADESYSTEAVEEAGALFSSMYKTVVGELASHQEDPGYERAEARYDEMTLYAGSLVPMFQDLSNRLQGDFDNLTRPILFSSDRDGNREIYVTVSDGSALARLTDNAAHDTDAVMSYDGTRIAFSSDRDGDSEIYSMNVDGSSLSRLTLSAGKDWAARWSPDGTQVLFLSERDGTRQVYVMGSNGSAPTALTTMGAYQLGGWSPDGQKVVFSSA